MASRRRFLASLGAATMTPRLGWGAVGTPVALSAAMTPDGGFLLVGLDAAGAIGFQVPLPARGHAAAAHPHLAEVVAIARRPGTFALVVDCATGAVSQTLSAPKGRHFYGHGAFSSDGTLLFTTENDVATGEGRIGVWDPRLGYARVDEFASGGIGPHEVLRLPSGNLAVANGGIRTHPDTGREKLNLDSMRANLAVFSPSGHLIDRAEVAEDIHHNSLRHIAVADDGTVACGFQWQGDPFDAPSLLALYRGDGILEPAQIDESQLLRLDGYIGSVSAYQQGGFAVSSPRGGRVLAFDRAGVLQEAHSAEDICGLTRNARSECLATDGFGRVYTLGSGQLRAVQVHPVAFDNHLVAL